MANNNKILTADQEMQLLKPIDDYVGAIQSKIDALRVDGTDKVVSLLNDIDVIKRDRIYTKDEKDEKDEDLEKKADSDDTSDSSDSDLDLNAIPL